MLTICYAGHALDLDINLTGAPNFRSPRHPNLNVYGVAQPRVDGLKAVLSVLGCGPNRSPASPIASPTEGAQTPHSIEVSSPSSQSQASFVK